MLQFLSRSFPTRRNHNDLGTRSSTARTQGKLFLTDRRGTIAIMMGIILPIFIGFLGLGVDVTNWYLSKRKLQTAVDAGAYAGALALSATQSDGEAEDAAVDSAKRNDYVAGSGASLVINIPPSSGPWAGDNSAVEVIALETQEVFLASLIYKKEVKVRARAVATAVADGTGYCILALDPEIDAAIEVQGTADLDAGCAIASNSHSDSSVEIWGNAWVSSTPISAVGDIAIGGNADVNSNIPLRSFHQSFLDPYGAMGRDLEVPASLTGCDYNRTRIRSDVLTLSPGRYCDGLNIQSSIIDFQPGIYVIDGGQFQVSGTSELYGEEVVFILTGSGNDYATVWFAGGTVADLSAPTSGDFNGVLFYQDANATALDDNRFLGGSEMDFMGALYFPNQEVMYTGGGEVSSKCMQIIARKVTFQGNGVLGNNCPADMDLEAITSLRIRLVE